ncbi:hypothetical protein AJ80_04308 [Polytolypa hystricis UAMH7299]|uniref:Piwi domain-containing protein n=1 Tax=Polytolypa hystricis (strain UAMH7299) TaxID=1447883 RepID=A0A2B7YCG8_POLH7|nr:hypothetical protein AJ80_04308 [Polytolypa hystricis UAMH7299]
MSHRYEEPPLPYAGDPTFWVDVAENTKMRKERDAREREFESWRRTTCETKITLQQAMTPVPTAKRPGLNTTGKEVSMAVNMYPITKFPTQTVYQYDVNIGNGGEKRAVIQKVWESKARKASVGVEFIFDGNKLAWSTVNRTHDINIMVDLNVEQGRPSAPANIFRLVVRPTKKLNLKVVDEYLKGNLSLADDAIEGLSFYDHVLRELPSKKFLTIKRSYFSEDSKQFDLSGGVFAYKGVYQAIRCVHPGRLAVNVDVANCCFWGLYSLLGAAIAVLDLPDYAHLIVYCKPGKDPDFGDRIPTYKFENLRRLHKLVVKARYRGNPCPDREWTIKKFLLYNAREYTVDFKDPATGKKETLTVEQYFKKKYDIFLDYWELPLVQMTKSEVVFPFEFLGICRPQRFPFKLNEFQIPYMIKFAATKPHERRKAVEDSKKMLNHRDDAVLKHFGLEVADNMMNVKARLLPSPEIIFGGNARVNPGTAGRWDLRGKKFLARNPHPLFAWGIGYFKGNRNAISRAQVEAFSDALVKSYSGHGGWITTTRPYIGELPNDPAKAVEELHNKVKEKYKLHPDLLIFVVVDHHSFHYLRLKKSSDCRFGVNSQVLHASHVIKCNGQYISNVLMKINAKLGGATARVASKITKPIPQGAMIIGADVSHSSPGSFAPSMAAITVAADEYACRYNGGCEANGERTELIREANMHSILEPMINTWCSTVGKGRMPTKIYYFRDGVSTGEHQQILRFEIQYIRNALAAVNEGKEWKGKFTVVLASKRHHIRAFPERPGAGAGADKNGNPLPGTLIEQGVTDAHSWDFFLYSHIALQGTSRPVHYHVLLDENNHEPKDLQNMIYEHCYQYMRSTTSVSLFPAVYYAHLVSNRARHHEDFAAKSGPRSGPQIKLTNPRPAVPEPMDKQLLPMPKIGLLPWRMWYI